MRAAVCVALLCGCGKAAPVADPPPAVAPIDAAVAALPVPATPPAPVAPPWGSSAPPIAMSLTVGPAKVDAGAGVPAATIVRKIEEAYVPGLRRCYKQALAIDATTSGAVAVVLTIDTAGRVTHATAAAPLADLGACFERLMSMWRFVPATPAATRAALTVTLSPRGGTPAR